jgi:uncharacterized membrane protein YecN with MAPEG domain
MEGCGSIGESMGNTRTFPPTLIRLKRQTVLHGKLCEYVPIAPTFQLFIQMVVADTISLSTGLFARIAAKEQIKRKRRLLDAGVWFLILGLGFFAMAVILLERAFYYPLADLGALRY